MDRRAFTSGLLATAAVALPRRVSADCAVVAEPLITITFATPRNAATAPIEVTEAEIRRLPPLSFATTTVWTSGLQHFTGVPLATLIAHYAISGRELELSAANDYRITIPMSEIGPQTPLVAYERNGKPMSARDYGPLWLVYDYDGDPASRTQTAFSRSIWQLDHITVTR